MRIFAVPLALVVLSVFAACGSASGGDPDRSPTVGARATARTISPGAPDAQTPTATAQRSAAAPKRLYIALGDSLSFGVGASDPPATGFVALVHKRLGPEWELLNLGVPGHDSRELIEKGPLKQALAEIRHRLTDGIDGNEVGAITLEIGGNDLLDIYFAKVIPGDCPSVVESLRRPDCVQALADALAAYAPNLELIIARLKEADPRIPIFLMTLYNPFSGGSQNLDELTELALEGMPDTPFSKGLHDIIRAQADADAGIYLVDVHPLFANKENEYIASDFIHPNDAGYRVMADAILAVMQSSGLLDR
jgi:lysophospholipase L1-like esterase